ncbi:MAG: ketoacyl-ACP synthase III [Tenuifilaceae bacterium]|jgi:3-oxoacyl-[acyl-carrier-protein] synthase-3|nr:ketoacyl-ACP synthase III [Bacteroidales bacterium]MDI9516074.1 ketoacyl-ACP synthase III [Bacteroidota bacterium]NLH56021.1 ketoacyl-ACP synthase III [Rikenellaceae bacterium]OQC62294.1 MAG: 3-oxoacyl-(acyl-carrier-protein) synthase 3 [Bacteroidetes bacterium ADurb.Bin008]HNV81640.1 ketoacyl-ACP synthase III [Tenuifilaceae bacterium]
MEAIKIIGSGLYAPGAPISNQELMKLTGIEFDAQKFSGKIGIENRHIAHLRGIDETTADFVTKAMRQAMENAHIDADAIGLFIVATDTPEYITPATAIIVQGRIQGGEKWSMSFDVSASCASFTMAFDTASRMLSSNPLIKYATIAGVYNMPAFIRPDDAFSTPIFSDGAAAFILTRDEERKSFYIGNQMLTDGTQHDFIGIYAGGAKIPVTQEVIANKQNGLLSLKPLPGDRNVRLWPMIVEKLLNNYGVQPDEVDHYIFTQINKSVILTVMEVLNQPTEKAHFVMDKYGYTGSACVPMAFHEGVRAGRIKRGEKVLFVASGAGLAVGSNLFVY